ncbi:MAG TPA: DUF4911 domain-containing protein [Polyangiaceae bacterium]|jgi:hypothetical protein|nr:DUF4911 domain-containing protein [Polyangiaceae bacterium]
MQDELLPWAKDDLEARRLLLPKEQIVYVRGILEASDGVAFLLAIRGGDVTIVGSKSRAHELNQILEDLRAELGSDWIELEPNFVELAQADTFPGTP